MYWGYISLWWVIFLVKGICSEVSEVFVAAGSQAVLHCECSPPSPQGAYVWWSKKDSGTVRIKLSSGLEQYGVAWQKRHRIRRVQCPRVAATRGDYRLYITDVREEDGGMYTCRVEDRGRLVEKTITLRVVKVSITPSAPVEGTDMSISCNVNPWPKNISIQWKLNEKPIRPQGGNDWNGIKVISAPNGAVPARVLSAQASQKLTGYWSCAVSSNSYDGEATQRLSVRGIIHPSINETRVYASVGLSVRLPCVFGHSLIPSDPAWERMKAGTDPPSNPPLLPSSFRPAPSSPRSPWDVSARVGSVAPGDEGSYECSAKVEGHRLSRSLQLVIAYVESSNSSGKGNHDLLTCQLSDSREVTEYEWVHITYDVNGTQIVTLKQKGRVLRINRLTEENLGEWACQFYGEKGILGNATYPTELMSGQAGGHNETRLSKNTSIVIGLSVLLVLLVLILAQMYKNCQRKKRILQYSAMEAIIHSIYNEKAVEERNGMKAVM